jgi:hypothetical protein
MFRGIDRDLFAVAVDVASTLQGDRVMRERAALLNGSRSLRWPGSRLRDLLDVVGVSTSNWTDHMLVASAGTKESLADKVKIGNPW